MASSSWRHALSQRASPLLPETRLLHSAVGKKPNAAKSLTWAAYVPTLSQPEVYLHFTSNSIDEEGNISNDGTRKFLQTYVDRYITWITELS
jgi:hypothetical protein